MAIKTTIAAALQDKIDSKAAIKAAIEAKGVTVGSVKLNQYASKVTAIAQDQTIPVGTGANLVTFYDFDGKVLKRERVATGGNATAPSTPTHQYLTFAEWNNPFTNVQSDIDTGVIYNTTDGKTYLFITLTPVTGLAPTLYFSKSTTSLMTINWGDGQTSTSTTSGNQTIQHTYAAAGDYTITVNNSAGGSWSMGQGVAATALFSNGIYKDCLKAVYIGDYVEILNYALNSHSSIKYISTGNKFASTNIIASFVGCKSLIAFVMGLPIKVGLEAGYSLEVFVFKMTASPTAIDYFMPNVYSLRRIIMPPLYTGIGYTSFSNSYKLNRVLCFNLITQIAANSFLNCYEVKEYVFLSTTPPALANINAFTGINPICKIYVPDASVDAYKAATNWITYANYIYPLSTKPQSDE